MRMHTSQFWGRVSVRAVVDFLRGVCILLDKLHADSVFHLAIDFDTADVFTFRAGAGLRPVFGVQIAADCEPEGRF